jgi:two-component system, OmpR family, response regulator
MGDEQAATILVVDDDESLRMLCRINLELAGYRVLEASTPEAARELLEAEAIDAVLLDLHLGTDDGLELVDQIRGKGAAVVLFTGSAEIEPETRDAVDAVLTKPFTIDDLLGTARSLLGVPLR